MKVRDVIRLIENDGWTKVAQKGSHRQFRHPIKSGKVTVQAKCPTNSRRAHSKVSFAKRG